MFGGGVAVGVAAAGDVAAAREALATTELEEFEMRNTLGAIPGRFMLGCVPWHVHLSNR